MQSGSSTVYPFAKAVAERVARANPKLGAPIVELTGTGAGFKLFCAGVGERFPDISNASRRMKASEAKQCAANGVKEVTEIQVGLDGLALATAKSTGLSGLTQRDVYMALAKTPFGKPQQGQDLEGRQRQAAGNPDPRLWPAAHVGTRDSLERADDDARLRSQSLAMVALKKANEAKYKAVCTAVSARTAPSSRPARTTI